MRVFYLLLSASLLFSCKPKTTNYSIKGKLVNGCDQSPLKNIRVQAIQVNKDNGFNESATSDANGDFEVLVSSSDVTTYRFMNLQQEVPLETVDYGAIPLYSNSTIHYRVKVLNPYTSSDTLWIVDPVNPTQYYPMHGPFHDTVLGNKIFTAVNTLAYIARSKTIINSNTSNEIKAWYKINSVNYSATKSVSAKPAVCNTIADTLTLIID